MPTWKISSKGKQTRWANPVPVKLFLVYFTPISSGNIQLRDESAKISSYSTRWHWSIWMDLNMRRVRQSGKRTKWTLFFFSHSSMHQRKWFKGWTHHMGIGKVHWIFNAWHLGLESFGRKSLARPYSVREREGNHARLFPYFFLSTAIQGNLHLQFHYFLYA